MTVRAFYGFIMDTSVLFEWLRDFGLIKRTRYCPVCKEAMKLKKVPDERLSDGCIWRCDRKIGGKRRGKEISVRHSSWFSHSKMTLSEILELTFWWVRGDKQDVIMNETGHGEHTLVDWGNFMRECCLVYLEKFGNLGKIGGEGVIVEIDESKFGKRKYRGNLVEGSWVIGGRERDNPKKCFFEVVEN
ncbi:hypothetical protein CAPTEDRAFT_203791 [Capitella teleta]|uniref:ISXO2-like transposase domain-containing protein n=1 Tax=Capitella teleta TaxID=283909 RepID=R7U9G0_CAPTE|nr:hypothetical protein CAPTEDRAFT_203791 [Capitella teleta]|eukprot:ELU02975.1 hypothetical protein CAPTEDRAFT_203791 [Capitella teleta]